MAINPNSGAELNLELKFEMKWNTLRDHNLTDHQSFQIRLCDMPSNWLISVRPSTREGAFSVVTSHVIEKIPYVQFSLAHEFDFCISEMSSGIVPKECYHVAAAVIVEQFNPNSSVADPYPYMLRLEEARACLAGLFSSDHLFDQSSDGSKKNLFKLNHVQFADDFPRAAPYFKNHTPDRDDDKNWMTMDELLPGLIVTYNKYIAQEFPLDYTLDYNLDLLKDLNTLKSVEMYVAGYGRSYEPEVSNAFGEDLVSDIKRIIGIQGDIAIECERHVFEF